TLEAVQAICTGTGDVAMDALEGLSLLVDKSLVRPEVGDTPQEGGDGEPRFGMLETVREYGLERLTASGERQTVQWQHAAYYLALTEQAEPHLKGQGQAVWLARLEREHDNLRAALRWARESEEVESGLRLAGAVW